MSAIVLWVLSLGGAVHGQSGTATLGGVVIDESNAVVPDVVVSVLARETGFQRETKTNAEGQFTVAALQPGRYKVASLASGDIRGH